MIRFPNIKAWKALPFATAFVVSQAVFAEEIENPPQAVFLDTSIPAAPDASEVIADVPSAFHWSRYQLGNLGDFTYTIYPDGSAKVMSGTERLIEAALILCIPAVMCSVTLADGSSFAVPVEQGLRPTRPITFSEESTARYIAQWILTGTAPEVDEEPAQILQEQSENGSQESANPVIENLVDPRVATPEAELIDSSIGDISASIENTGEPIATGVPEGEDVSEGAGDLLQISGSGDELAIDQSDEAENGPSEIECNEVDPFFPDLCTGPKPQRPAVVENVAPATIARAEPSSSSNQPDSSIVLQPEAVTPPDKNLWSFSDLNCSITASTSLAFVDGGNAKPRVSLGCGTQITDRLSFRGALIGYAIPSHQEDWDPDFTYAFNYKVSDRINLSYSNYSGSFSDDGGAIAGLFDGNLRANFKLPDIPLTNDRSLPCSASVGLPDPTDTSVNLSCGYSVTPDLRLGATAYFYPNGVQDEYDLDYSYTVSYRINDTWRLSYNNYSNNRWPWNRGASPSSGITGGSLSLTHHLSF